MVAAHRRLSSATRSNVDINWPSDGKAEETKIGLRILGLSKRKVTDAQFQLNPELRGQKVPFQIVAKQLTIDEKCL